MTSKAFIYCFSMLGLFGCVASCYADSPRTTLHKDPFERPKLEQPTGSASSRYGSDGVPAEWELRATLVAGRDSLADVGGVIVRVGEEIEGYRLLSVGEGSAVLLGNGSRLVLTVEDEKAETGHE